MNRNENLKFDSVILAGGFGKRLAPLTDTIPKPLLPIDSESAYLRNLKLLRKNGFMKTAVTTMYLKEKIHAVKFGKGEIEFINENEPLGSAGAVAQIKKRAEDCLLILSGDAICDFDLAKAKEEFLKSGCDAGIILSRTNEIGEYGSVCVRNGMVTEFAEKPSARDTLSDLINTGIYFIGKSALGMIPENKYFDFAKDLFPAMLSMGMKIAGLEPMGHWFDIGSFGEYHRCNMWVSEGRNCIGRHTSIHPNARIEHSVIFDNCTIGNSVIRGCIIGEGAVIGNDCILPAGCVVGPKAELRDGSCLAPGSIVQTGETIVGDAFIDMFPRQKQLLIFDDDCVIAEDSDDGYFVRLGRLLGGEGSVIAFAEGSGLTLQQCCELACGSAEAGSGCTVVSGGNAAMAAFAAAEYGSRCAFIARAGDKTEIRLFSSNGMSFSREELRNLSSKTPKTSKLSGNVYLLPHGVLIKRYLNYLRGNTSLPEKLNIADGRENKILKEVAEELGLTPSNDGAEFRLSADGERVSAVLSDGREISYWQLIAICCIEGKRSTVILPRDTPNTVEQILKRHSVKVKFYGDSESGERKLAESDRLHRDGILLALTASSLAEKNGVSLEKLAEKIPPFSVMIRAVYADRDRMYSVIARIREEGGSDRCACFDFGEGRVNIFPSAAGRFRLVAEAADTETAEEISLRAIDMLEKKKDTGCQR